MENAQNKYHELSFEKKIHLLAEQSLVKIAEKGDWFNIPYDSRVSLPRDFLREVWNMVDANVVKQKMKERIEQELADRLVNQIAAELSTDIKQLLSDEERRKEIRSIANKHLLHLSGWNKTETNL